jgi:Zn-dependent peptidase ImmA (M78 family)
MNPSIIAVSNAKLLISAVQPEFPVDPRQICEHLHVEYRERQMDPYLDGVYIVTSNGTPYVGVNSHSSKPPGRRRFTAGHEIGHHVMAVSLRSQNPYFLDASRMPKTPLEHACNVFSANIMMPEDVVCQWWQDLSGNPKFRVTIMTERFGVTPSAMRVRLEELGLMKPFAAGEYYR